MTNTGGDRTVELWVRSFAPTEHTARRKRVMDRLETLVEAGDLDDVTVRVWGDEIAVEGDQPAAAREILTRVERFEEWADAADAELGRAFERRRVECSFTERTCVSQRLPAMALAEFADGDLQCVTPHRREGAQVSVPERVRWLAGVDGEGGPGSEGETTALPAD